MVQLRQIGKYILTDLVGRMVTIGVILILGHTHEGLAMQMTVTLRAKHGTLSLTDATGLQFHDCDGDSIAR